MRDHSSACGLIVTNDSNNPLILINTDSSTRVSILLFFTLFLVNFVFNYFLLFTFIYLNIKKLMKQKVIFDSNRGQTL